MSAGTGSGAVLPARTPRIEVRNLDAMSAEVLLSDTDISVANSIRRVMMAEVPCIAFNLVYVYDNSGVMPDEFVAHRIGLMPIRWRPTNVLPQDKVPFPHECECDFTAEVCPRCSVSWILDVFNDAPPDGDPLPVTSMDLRLVDSELSPLVEIAHFVTSEERGICDTDRGIILTKLGPGQRLTLRAVANLGIGKMHAKFNPTATVAMRYEPDIRLNYDLLEKVAPADRKRFVTKCQPGVFQFDDASEQIIVANPKIANNIDEIRKIGMQIAKTVSSSENIVSVGFVPERYIFTVESSGSLTPAQIIQSGLQALIAKMSMVSLECSKLTGGGGFR